MTDRTALLGPGAGGESKQGYGSAAEPFPWKDPAMLRMGSGEARAQGEKLNCFSHAGATAIRASLRWMINNCEGMDIAMVQHSTLLAQLETFFSPGGGTSGLKTVCAQMCSPMSQIRELLAAYNLEPFAINTKAELIATVANYNRTGESVILGFTFNPNDMLNFTMFGKEGYRGNKKYWDNTHPGYTTPRRDPRRVAHDFRNLQPRTESSPYYEPPGIWGDRDDHMGYAPEPRGIMTGGHAVFVSGIGVDRRYKDGDPALRNCDKCATGPKDDVGFRTFSDADKKWFIDHPGEFRPGCTCVLETPYIEIKNSWGPEWGSLGYMKIALNMITDDNINQIDITTGGVCRLCSAACEKISKRKMTGPEFHIIGLRPITCRKSSGVGQSTEIRSASKGVKTVRQGSEEIPFGRRPQFVDFEPNVGEGKNGGGKRRRKRKTRRKRKRKKTLKTKRRRRKRRRKRKTRRKK